MFNSKKRNSRNKLLSVRLSLEEMDSLNKIIKQSPDFNNKTDFIRHLILISPEYLLYTKKQFDEATSTLAHFEHLLSQENYEALKPYYIKYFNLKLKTHQRYLKTLNEEEANEVMNSFVYDSIQTAKQFLVKEARKWRNLYEEAFFAFNQHYEEAHDVLETLEN